MMQCAFVCGACNDGVLCAYFSQCRLNAKTCPPEPHFFQCGSSICAYFTDGSGGFGGQNGSHHLLFVFLDGGMWGVGILLVCFAIESPVKTVIFF